MLIPNTAIKRLATEIVTELFTSGNGTEAWRLVLQGPQGQDLGGWGQTPMADKIAARLAKAVGQTVVFCVGKNYAYAKFYIAGPDGIRTSTRTVTPLPGLSRRERYDTLVEAIREFDLTPPKFISAKCRKK